MLNRSPKICRLLERLDRVRAFSTINTKSQAHHHKFSNLSPGSMVKEEEMNNVNGNDSTNPSTLLLLGDLMLGRLIDQLLPMHIDEPSESRLISSMVKSDPSLKTYNHLSPWGNSLHLLKSSSLVLGNLETAITTHPTKWPDKVFNYRMHPDNTRCLTKAGVDYVSLANNHTLDFCEPGLIETVKTLKKVNIKFAGAGETEDEAKRPAVLKLPAQSRQNHPSHQPEIQIYSFSDHPQSWSQIPIFNLLPTYTSSSFSSLQSQLNSSPTSNTDSSPLPSLKIVSLHWGPNYAWQPDRETIVNLAHFLIDDCAVDLIHGHSSHHLQGLEIYHGKPIIYGCGDFIDDYAVIPEYRSDLSAAWRVTLEPESKVEVAGVEKLAATKIEIFPNRIRRFQAELMKPGDPDHEWVANKFRKLSTELGTIVEKELGDEGQVILDLRKQER